MRSAALEVAHVGMSIPIDDLGLLPCPYVSKEMTIGRLVSAAEHNDETAAGYVWSQGSAEMPLVGLDIT